MTVLKVRFGFTGAWVLQGIINGEAAGEGSGKSVTINKNGRVVGIVDDSGYVRVFEFKKKSLKIEETLQLHKATSVLIREDPPLQ